MKRTQLTSNASLLIPFLPFIDLTISDLLYALLGFACLRAINWAGFVLFSVVTDMIPRGQWMKGNISVSHLFC